MDRLPSGKLKRALIITAAIAVAAQGLSAAAIELIHVIRELLQLFK